MSSTTPPPPPPPPKTWLITSLTPLTRLVATAALARGDNVSLGHLRGHSASIPLDPSPRLLLVELDLALPSTLASAVALTLSTFSSLTILLISGRSTTVFGPLTALAGHAITSQFEEGFFGPLTAIKAVLPAMRRARFGHVIVVTSQGAMGTGGMSIAAAADHGIEGLMDGLSYEVAPFGVRCSVVQAGFGVAGMERVEVVEGEGADREGEGEQISRMRRVVSRWKGPERERVVDVARVVVEIGGLENPPGRITVGVDEVEMVKERLKTVSEELEEFLEASLRADIPQQGE